MNKYEYIPTIKWLKETDRRIYFGSCIFKIICRLDFTFANHAKEEK